VITVIGIPVYYHYCGGELEEVSYVLKSSNCCGGEEDNTDEATNDCCKDENVILKSNLDFTIKKLNVFAFVKTFNDVFYISLLFSNSIQSVTSNFSSVYAESPPPKLQLDLLISTSVLRI